MSEQADDDQKKFEPSQKKIDDAIQKGDVAKSQELGTLFVLAGGTMVVTLFSGSIALELFKTLKGQLANLDQIATDPFGLMQFAQHMGGALFLALSLPFAILMLTGIMGQAIQHRLILSTESLKPKLSKLSPLAGFKRLFGKEAIANFLKGVAKISLVGITLTWVIWPERAWLDAIMRLDLPLVLPATLSMVQKLLMTTLILVAIIAGADYFYQYSKWRKRLMMTLEEMKEEHKQSEGNPEIKAKVKQIQRERARSRMMAEVPKATVVVTNPTHFAVALKYEDDMAAPRCVAKGTDAVAQRIRALAEESRVPLVENPPLARSLYASVDIDEEVPEEHYRAVAEVITYVMRLKRGERVGAFRPKA